MILRQLTNWLSLSEETHRKAANILLDAMDRGVFPRGGRGAMAASVYRAAITSGEWRTQKEIGEALGITQDTVAHHYARLTAELGIEKQEKPRGSSEELVEEFGTILRMEEGALTTAKRILEEVDIAGESRTKAAVALYTVSVLGGGRMSRRNDIAGVAGISIPTLVRTFREAMENPGVDAVLGTTPEVREYLSWLVMEGEMPTPKHARRFVGYVGESDPDALERRLRRLREFFANRGEDPPSGWSADAMRSALWRGRGSEKKKKYLKWVVETTGRSLELPAQVEELAKLTLTRAYSKGMIRGRPMQDMCVAAVYVACRTHGTPVTVEEVCAALPHHAHPVTSLRCHKLLIKEFGLSLPSVVPQDIAEKYGEKLGLSQRTIRIAREILDSVGEGGFSGRNPRGVAGAALYIAAKVAGERKTQREMAEAVGVTEPTLRKGLQLLPGDVAEESGRVPPNR